jgi:hypothetical protein
MSEIDPVNVGMIEQSQNDSALLRLNDGGSVRLMGDPAVLTRILFAMFAPSKATVPIPDAVTVQ